MTTLEAVTLSPALQALIDARLDTIDRMLLGAVVRQDRLSIVRDVESQIHEQLQTRDPDELSREEVLAVLTSLDPPEAYLPEASDDFTSRPRRIPTIRPASGQPSPAASGTARTSGILGILTLVGAFFLPTVAWMLGILLESGTTMVVGAVCSSVLVLTGGILAIVFASRAGLRNGWAIAGLVTSLVAMPLVFCVNVLGLMLFS